MFEDISADLFSHANHHFLVYADRLSRWATVTTWKTDSHSPRLHKGCSQRFHWHRSTNQVPVRRRFSIHGLRLYISPQEMESRVCSVNPSLRPELRACRICSEINEVSDNENCTEQKIRRREIPQSCARMVEYPKKRWAGDWYNVFLVINCDRSSRHTTFWMRPYGRIRWMTATGKQPNWRLWRGSDTTVNRGRSPHFLIGQDVRFQDNVTKRWGQTGVVVTVGKHRDYHIKRPSGRVLWRNRRFFRPYVPIEAETSKSSVDQRRGSKRGVRDDVEAVSVPSSPSPRRSNRFKRATENLFVQVMNKCQVHVRT